MFFFFGQYYVDQFCGFALKLDMFTILPEDPTPEIQTFVSCDGTTSLQKNGYADGFAFPLSNFSIV